MTSNSPSTESTGEAGPDVFLPGPDGPLVVCSRCIYDERVAGISFDTKGVCNYCHQVDALTAQYGTGQESGREAFDHILAQIRRHGAGKQYDCVIGVSGGTDSSYLIHAAREEWNLRPLAVHYDNTWNTATATQNIFKVLRAYNVDLHTHVVNNTEMDDIFRAFFLAGVAEIDAPTDLGFAYVLRQAAAQHSIRYILEGHSFVAEGITPLGRNYFDGKYIESVHERFGSRVMDTYPLMTFGRFMKSVIVDHPLFIRPLWYLDYSKAKAQQTLRDTCDWQYYGGHHLENRMTAFLHGVYAPQKFGADFRNNSLSAQVRDGHRARDEAWLEYCRPPVVETGLVDYVKRRLRLDDGTYGEAMKAEPKSWQDYPTYKERFVRLRPLFWLLAKSNRVPMSFYLKYCF